VYVLCIRLVWRMRTVCGLVAGLRAAHSKNGGSNPGKNKKFFLFRSVHIYPGAYSAFYLVGNARSLSRRKGRKAAGT
jgi:hypothetical protein